MKELLTSVWSPIPEASGTRGEHASPTANTRLPSNHNWPKQNHAWERVQNSESLVAGIAHVLIRRTRWYYIWEQVKNKSTKQLETLSFQSSTCPFAPTLPITTLKATKDFRKSDEQYTNWQKSRWFWDEWMSFYMHSCAYNVYLLKFPNLNCRTKDLMSTFT